MLSLQLISEVSLIAHGAIALGIAVDLLFRNRQRMKIMYVVWPLTALYWGLIALFIYARWGTQNSGSTTEKPNAISTFLATSHCGAGCTMGDVIGETFLFLSGVVLFHSKLLSAYTVDFLLAFVLGIAFQYLTIAPMKDLSASRALGEAIKIDALSLSAFEIGMFGWMAAMNFLFFETPPLPNSPVYWFMMQLAMIAGFATSFPVNGWLLGKGIKERM